MTVAPGDISTMTIAFIANKKVTDAVDVSLDKKFANGPTKGTGAFTLTVKNEGALIAPGTAITVRSRRCAPRFRPPCVATSTAPTSPASSPRISTRRP